MVIEQDGTEHYVFGGGDNLPIAEAGIVGKVAKPKRDRAKRLTVNNATKEQLKQMVHTFELRMSHQYCEIEELKKQNKKLLDLFCNATVFIYDNHGGDVCKKVLDGECGRD